jgi:hypothetical protein
MTSRRRFVAPLAPGRWRARFTLLAAGLAVAASACSTATPKGSYVADRSTPTGQGTTSGAAGPEKPKFASEYERTCSDGLGFGGVAAYTRTAKAIHPAVLLSKATTDRWSQQVPFDAYPKGWIIGYTDDVSRAELVVCYERTATTPAGKTCQMTDDKTHEPFTLTMYNTRYRLRVLEARTGRVLHEKTGQAASTECPTLTFVSGDDDRTKYYTDADPRDYRGVLKPFIAP